MGVLVARSIRAGAETTAPKAKESSVHTGRKSGDYTGVSGRDFGAAGCLVRNPIRARRAWLGQVCEVDFMVKLLRACVWMPWRMKAMKDASSCDKLREAATRL